LHISLLQMPIKLVPSTSTSIVATTMRPNLERIFQLAIKPPILRTSLDGICRQDSKKCSSLPSKPWFRNTLSMTVFLDKQISMKISHMGTIQLSGCITTDHIRSCLAIVVDCVLETSDMPILPILPIKCIHFPCMFNYKFDCMFEINRDLAFEIISNSQEYECFGSTFNIGACLYVRTPPTPFPSKLDCDIWDMMGCHSSGHASFEEYLKMRYDDQVKMPKVSRNTFTIFDSGEVVVSGRHLEVIEPSYLHLIGLLENARKTPLISSQYPAAVAGPSVP
jgi:hypothetical protein